MDLDFMVSLVLRDTLGMTVVDLSITHLQEQRAAVASSIDEATRLINFLMVKF